MATFTALRGAAGFPVAGHGFGGNAKRASGQITITANPAAADVYEMVRVPKGAVVVGGMVMGGPLNTAGNVSSIDADIGFASDTDAFGNLGAWSQTAVLSIKPETGYLIPFGGLLLTSGPQTMDSEKIICVTVVTSTASGSFTSTVLSMYVDYYLP